MLFYDQQRSNRGSQSKWDCYIWKILLPRSHSMNVANSYLCSCNCACMKRAVHGKMLNWPDLISIILGSFYFCLWTSTGNFIHLKSVRGIWPTKVTQIMLLIYKRLRAIWAFCTYSALSLLFRERTEVYNLHLLSSVHKWLYKFFTQELFYINGLNEMSRQTICSEWNLFL